MLVCMAAPNLWYAKKHSAQQSIVSSCTLSHLLWKISQVKKQCMPEAAALHFLTKVFTFADCFSTWIKCCPNILKHLKPETKHILPHLVTQDNWINGWQWWNGQQHTYTSSLPQKTRVRQWEPRSGSQRLKSWCLCSSTGRLVSGDCKKNIHVWQPQEGGTSWKIDQRPFSSHSKSVEDLQWSPTEATVRQGSVKPEIRKLMEQAARLSHLVDYLCLCSQTLWSTLVKY